MCQYVVISAISKVDLCSRTSEVGTPMVSVQGVLLVDVEFEELVVLVAPEVFVPNNRLKAPNQYSILYPRLLLKWRVPVLRVEFLVVGCVVCFFVFFVVFLVLGVVV